MYETVFTVSLEPLSITKSCRISIHSNHAKNSLCNDPLSDTYITNHKPAPGNHKLHKSMVWSTQLCPQTSCVKLCLVACYQQKTNNRKAKKCLSDNSRCPKDSATVTLDRSTPKETIALVLIDYIVQGIGVGRIKGHNYMGWEATEDQLQSMCQVTRPREIQVLTDGSKTEKARRSSLLRRTRIKNVVKDK